MHFGGALDKQKGRKMFFFEEKNQKTFDHDFVRIGVIASSPNSEANDKSLFASFSSEKEDSVFLHFSKTHNTL